MLPSGWHLPNDSGAHGTEEGTELAVCQLRRASGAIEFLLGVALVGLTSERAVAIDISGPWSVRFYVTRSALTFEDTCILTVAQSGASVAASGPCRGAADPASLQGTLDQQTGVISGSGVIGTCGAIAFSGHVAASAPAFTGEFTCSAAAVSGGINANRCGNGQIDGTETCDEGERNGGCCTRDCVLLPAGTECADDGSQCTSDLCDASGQCQHAPLNGACDDSNTCTSGDTCVNGVCVGNALADGAPCDDSNACSNGDHCLAAVCTAAPRQCPPCLACDTTGDCVPTIANRCEPAATSALMLKNRSADALAWTWENRQSMSPGALGNPTANTDYDLCLFDGRIGPTGVSSLLLAAQAPAGSDWSATNGGYRYDRSDLTPDGVRRIVADAGAGRRSRLLVRARGPRFALPPLSGLRFPLTVQLMAGDTEGARCWSARYDWPRQQSNRGMTTTLRNRPGGAPPNILLIALDDTRQDGIDHMPNLAAVAAQGVSFSNSFAVSPLCAPSRATMLTGLHSEHHGVRTLGGVIGGAHLLREQGTDRETIATWLQAAGYRTGLFGKYVNGYGYGPEQSAGPGATYYVPPGWTRWRAMASPEHYGGVNGATYTLVDEHGGATTYDDRTSDAQYSTDLLAAELRAFIADSVDEGRPFFAVWTPYASHAETTTFLPEPAARHYGFFSDLPAWRPASWAEADVSDKPKMLQGFGTSQIAIDLTDRIRIGAYDSLLAVDEQLQVIRDRLVELGIDRNTVILVTSDNGACWGEHRLFVQSKDCLYEECLRVPLIIYDPRVTPSTAVQTAPALNLDLAPTVAAFAGVTPPVVLDGTSLADWVTGPPPTQWRSDFLMTHWRSTRDETLVYSGQPSDGDQVRIDYGDSRAQPRPSVLFEFDSDNRVTAGTVRVAIGADANATFLNFALAVPVQVPGARATAPILQRVHVMATDALSGGVFIAVERDRAGVMYRGYAGADAFGVRDVRNGFSFVRYETGEFELYDLNLDPAQLENKADDPSYAATRARLAGRLSELLQ